MSNTLEQIERLVELKRKNPEMHIHLVNDTDTSKAAARASGFQFTGLNLSDKMKEKLGLVEGASGELRIIDPNTGQAAIVSIKPREEVEKYWKECEAEGRRVSSSLTETIESKAYAYGIGIDRDIGGE